jgi:hypothetical protein
VGLGNREGGGDGSRSGSSPVIAVLFEVFITFLEQNSRD